MKITKIIPKTIPILILLREKRKIWGKYGQKTLYLVVFGGYAYTLGGDCYIHLTTEAYIFLPASILAIARGVGALLFAKFLARTRNPRF